MSSNGASSSDSSGGNASGLLKAIGVLLACVALFRIEQHLRIALSIRFHTHPYTSWLVTILLILAAEAALVALIWNTWLKRREKNAATEEDSESLYLGEEKPIP